MTFRYLVAAAVVAIAMPASAATQYERPLLLKSGTYSTAQIERLRQAYEDGDLTRVRHILAARAPAARDLSDVHVRQMVGSALESNEFQRARLAAQGGGAGSEASLAQQRRQIALAAGTREEGRSLSELLYLENQRQD